MKDKQFELELLERMSSITMLVEKYQYRTKVKKDKYFGYDVSDPDEMQELRVYKDVLDKMKGMVNDIVYLQQPAITMGELYYNENTAHYELNGFIVEEDDQMEALVKDFRHQTLAWTRVIMKYDEDAIEDAEYLTHGWYLGGEYGKYIYAPKLDGVKVRVRDKTKRFT